jgi:hypothetical protein
VKRYFQECELGVLAGSALRADLAFIVVCALVGRLSRGGEFLFFAASKKRNPKKDNPLPVSLRCASGNLWCSPQPGLPQTRPLRRLKQHVWLFRLGLCASARAEGAKHILLIQANLS